MWNRSYRWQRRLRLAAGVLVLLGLAVGLVIASGTSPAARARTGARDLLAEIRSTGDQLIEVSVPADLEPRVGTLVYQEREDGGARVIGRVVQQQAAAADQVALKIRLMAQADAAPSGGVVKGAPASLDLRAAVRLLINPGTPIEEVARARDTIWPSVRASVLPDMIDGLIRVTTEELAALDEKDEALIAASLQRLRDLLKPLEDELVDRLAKRTWETVGVQGLAAGIMRKTSEGVQNSGINAAQWWWKLLGSPPKMDPVERPFFTDETRDALRKALEEETLAFWNENRAAILDALKKVVIERRGDFEAAFKERWASLLYERAILPAWEAGQDKVLESVQAYANDFAARRLLTREGGPRLMFAYALRSSLNISNDPLLVFIPGGPGGSGRVVYEPLLR